MPIPGTRIQTRGLEPAAHDFTTGAVDAEPVDGGRLYQRHESQIDERTLLSGIGSTIENVVDGFVDGAKAVSLARPSSGASMLKRSKCSLSHHGRTCIVNSYSTSHSVPFQSVLLLALCLMELWRRVSSTLEPWLA